MSTTDTTPLGLRERKKQQTRQHIAETARRLFAERGLERVTIAEIARAADVSEQTVFNYCPRKEDLVFWRLADFEERLLAAVREREPGTSAVAAFRRFLLAQRGLLGKTDPDARDELGTITRTIVESPALLAREQQILDGYTTSLADLLADETGARAGDVAPLVAASAMMGIHRALINNARARILTTGTQGASVAREIQDQAERAFALIAQGLDDYAIADAAEPDEPRTTRKQ